MTGDDFTKLVRDLGRLADGPAVTAAVTKAVDQTGARVAATWNAKLYRDGSAKLTGGSITHDTGVAHQFGLFQTDASTPHGAEIIAEIGPKRGNHRQAGIVRLLENGSVHNPPHGYGAGALQEHEDDYEAAIGFAIWAVQKEADLP